MAEPTLCPASKLNRLEIERLFLTGVHGLPQIYGWHSRPTETRHIAVGRVGDRPLFVAFAFRNGWGGAFLL